MEHLFDKLQEYSNSHIYPYHMPGHKRRACGKLPEEMYRLDITEIDGFDNLHQPEEILKDLQKRAAELYGAEESFYLINGSTAGILSAVSSALEPGGHLLMTRNCHKSVYHAAYLRNLTVSYLYPEKLEEYDIFGEVTPQQVKEALDREPDIQAVLIVSPTYEGRISDVRGIAAVVHEKGIPLIVDEAHGAHLGFSEEFAENSCKAGADIVIHSVHKTLPSCTQTALLHRNTNRIDRERLLRFLHIYQSSSPSYLLMASIDNALQYVEEEGSIAFPAFAARYREMMDRLAGCKKLHFLVPEQKENSRKRQDIGKLLISTKNTAMSGKQLYELLLQKYHLQLEMAGESYALAMFTVRDAPEGYERMEHALLEIDEMLAAMEEDASDAIREEVNESNKKEDEKKPLTGTEAGSLQEAIAASGTGMPTIPLAKGWDMPTKQVKLCQSIGCYSGEFVNLYPPGIPLLVPGEPITEQLAAEIAQYVEEGLNVQGIILKENVRGENIPEENVLKESIRRENISGENVLKETIRGENISGGNVLKESIRRENISGENVLKENIPSENIPRENVLEDRELWINVIRQEEDETLQKRKK